MLRLKGVLALALLVVAAPALAQPPDEAEGYPPEMLLPDAEAAAFFEAAQADPDLGGLLEDLPADAAGAMDAVIREFIAPGEQAPGWPDIGADIGAVVAARASGPEGIVSDAVHPFGVLRTYFADRPIDAMVPGGWVIVGRHGEPFEGANVVIEIGHISPKLLMVMRVDYAHRGRMRCQQRAQTQIYANPRIAASQADTVSYMMARRLAADSGAMSLCFGADEREPGLYVTRVYDRTGRRIPGMDNGQPPFRIVPAEPFPGGPVIR